MATRPKNLRVSRDAVAELRDQLRLLAESEVLVGFPEDSTAREENEGEPEITNAALAYIHDNGDPDARIPQREFMRPAMEEVEGPVANAMQRIARAVFMRQTRDVMGALAQVGSRVELAIKKKINEGIPPPLSERTLLARANRGGKSKGRQGALWELAWREAGADPGTELAKPLIDTAQMRNAVKYVIRKRRARKSDG